jgi:dihydrodipicolinate synthase/N-acetylneuraminate lyase
MPLALSPARKLDERRQRALCRYYSAAGSGGIAAGVHTTQFEIRDPKHTLFDPVLSLVADEMNRLDARRPEPLIRIAGICGRTEQAVAEATRARELGYHLGLLSLTALRDDDDAARLAHCRTVAEVLSLVGFYLQRAVGGPVLSYRFWREFAEIPRVAAIKIAPFNRYQTLDVIRAVTDAGRDDIALYTGNDDTIVADLLTPFPGGCRIVGGLLGHWSVWTRRAVELLETCHRVAGPGGAIPRELMQRAAEVTDANAAFFDAAHDFAGCIVGLHEVLRRQGLFERIETLNPSETLSPGQSDEIDRVYRAYPHLNDDAFVAEHLDEWLRP